MLPNYSKNWNFSVNSLITLPKPDETNQYSSIDLFNKKIWYEIKNYLKNNGWTVVYSCNGINSPSLVTDQWSSLDSILTNNFGNNTYINAFPWIILKNDSISTNFSILICAGGSSPGIKIAPSGFLLSGGSIQTIPPTLVTNDLISVSNTLRIITSTTVTFSNAVIHFMNSSDNLSYRILICIGSAVSLSFFIEKAITSLSTSLWSIPFVWMYNGSLYTRFLLNQSSSSIGISIDSSYKDNSGSDQSGYDDFYDQARLYPYSLIGKDATTYAKYCIGSSLSDTYFINPTYNYVGCTLSDNLNSNKYSIFNIFTGPFIDLGTTALNFVIPWNGTYVRTY